MSKFEFSPQIGGFCSNLAFLHLGMCSLLHLCLPIKCIFMCSFCVKTFQGHREWVRRVRVNNDGECCGVEILKPTPLLVKNVP